MYKIRAHSVIKVRTLLRARAFQGMILKNSQPVEKRMAESSTRNVDFF